MTQLLKEFITLMDNLKTIKDIITSTKFENKVFLVGGACRDITMSLPIKDIDLVIDMPNGGIEFVDWLYDNYNTRCNGRVIYETYRTAKITLDNIDIECVAPRNEQYRVNNRKPNCTNGNIQDDCFRRDFTINTLFYNLSTGELLDMTGLGLLDIANKILRTPLDPLISFRDDPLRMMRLIRFACIYDFSIEKGTWDGCIKCAKYINSISNERISDELSKILTSEDPAYGIGLLYDSTLLHYIIPEFDTLIHMTQNKYHYDTVWGHTLCTLKKTKPILINRLAALLHDIGKGKTRTEINGKVQFLLHDYVGSDIARNILRRLKMSNQVIEDVCFAILNHMRTKDYGDEVNVRDRVIRKLQADLGNRIDLVLDLINADNMSHREEYCMPNQVNNIYLHINRLKNNKTSCETINLPINGNDIMNIKNIAPGSKVKLYLNCIKELYFDNPSITRNECIKYIKNIEL